jgi:hypothetical protein
VVQGGGKAGCFQYPFGDGERVVGRLDRPSELSDAGLVTGVDPEAARCLGAVEPGVA